MHLVQFCTQPPEKFFWNATVFANPEDTISYMVLGRFFCKECNDDVLMIFCATHLDRVWPPYPGSICHFLCIIPISVHVGNDVLLILSSSVSCHLQIFSSNQHLTYCLCNVAGFQLLLHLPCVKFTDTTPSPESMITFHVVLFMLYALLIMPCWHATYT